MIDQTNSSSVTKTRGGGAAASLFAAFFVPFVMLCLTATVGAYDPTFGFKAPIIPITILYGAVLIAAHVYIVGAPLFFLLKRRFKVRLWNSILVGMLVALAPLNAIIIPQALDTLDGGNSINLHVIPFAEFVFGATGLLGGTAFWATWAWLEKRSKN